MNAPIAIREARRDDLPRVAALLADDPLGAGRELPGDPLAPVYAAAFDAMAGQGGNVLLVATARARSAGCGLVQLTSDASRADAHRFYERLGFLATHVGMKLAIG